MSWSMQDLLSGAQFVAGMPQRVADTAKTYAEIPLLGAQTQEAYSRVPLNLSEAGYYGGLTTKTAVDTELTRLQVQARQRQIDMYGGAGGQGQTGTTYTNPSDFGVSPNAPPPPASSTMPPAQPVSTAPAQPPASTALPIVPSVPPAPAAPAPAAVPPVPPVALAVPPQGDRYNVGMRYGPGSYQLADVSGMTPAPTSATAPAPGPVSSTPLPAPPPAPPAAPGATPVPGAPDVPASATMPPARPASVQLAQAGAPAGQQQGGAPEVSPNASVLPGVGPVPRMWVGDMMGAIANGQDPIAARKELMLQRYRRLAELTSAPQNNTEWNQNVLQAYNEGLITRTDVQREWNKVQSKEVYLKSFTDAQTQLQADVELGVHGGAIGPGGIGPARGPQGMIEGATGAQEAGRGATVNVTIQDPNDPTKTTTVPVPAPGVYEFMRSHPGSIIAPPTPQSQPHSQADPIDTMPRPQALASLMQRESGGRNIETTIKKPDGTPASSASGYYQIDDPTWQHAAQLAGLRNAPPRAILASRADQDAAASALLDERGSAPWLASNPWRRRASGSVAPSTPPTTALAANQPQLPVPPTPPAAPPATQPSAGQFLADQARRRDAAAAAAGPQAAPPAGTQGALPAGTQFAGPGAMAPPPPAPSQATPAQYLGPGGPTQPFYGPTITTPGQRVESAMDNDQKLLERDNAAEPKLRDEANAARSSIITTSDIIHRLDATGAFTGSGADFRKSLMQVMHDYSPDVVNRIMAAVGGDKFDPSKVDQVRILAKELFSVATQQEQGLTPQGGAHLTQMFADMMPNIGMSGDAIRDMTNVFRVMQQANIDYITGAMQHYGNNRSWTKYTRDPGSDVGFKRYSPVADFDRKFFDQEGPNAPAVYTNAAGLINGRKDWWANMKRPQQEAAIDLAYRVNPGFQLKEAMLPPGWR